MMAFVNKSETGPYYKKNLEATPISDLVQQEDVVCAF